MIVNYTFDDKKKFIVHTQDKGVIVFNLGPDGVMPIENEDGSLSWPEVNIELQAERNRISEALVDVIKQQRFAQLLYQNPDTAYTTFLSEI